MAETPSTETDSAAGQTEDSGSRPPSRPSSTSELWAMFAPIIGFLKEFFRSDHPQHQQRLIGSWIAAGLLVGGIGWGLYESTSTQSSQATWGTWIGVPTAVNREMISSLKDGEVLTGVGDLRVKVYTQFLNKNEDADPEVRSWARLLLAETRLRMSLRRGQTSDRIAKRSKGDRRIRNGRNDDIRKAQQDFERVRGDAPEGSQLRQRALFGLAVAAEATCSGTQESIDEAVAAYRKLESTDGPYKDLAANRRKALEHADASEFYKWFVSVSETPAPEFTNPLGAAGAPTGTPTGDDPFPPGLLESLTGGNLDTPGHKSKPDDKDKDKDIRKIPDSLQLPGKKPAAKKPAEKKPAEKKPAAKKPAEKKPAAKKPATKKPATKKPATKKPATKKPATKKPATKKKLGE